MKKILFIIPNYLQGGTNKSLQNVLPIVEQLGYTPMVYSLKKGGLYQTIFNDYIVTGWNISSFIFRKFGLFSFLLRSVDMSVFKGFFVRITYKIEVKHLERLYQPDIVVAFEEGGPTKLCYYFKHAKRIAWVQCDYHQHYIRIKHNAERVIERRAYSKYDKIVCVSKSTQKSMMSYYPELSDKITFAYNILDVDTVKEKSLVEKDDVLFDNNRFTIISVGRFDPIKRFDRIPSIVNQIRSLGTTRDFKWFIIAEGEIEREMTLAEIEKYQVGDSVFLLGGKDNPYPYISKSNLLVCLSESESWSYVINEAKILQVPVVTTDFEAAYEVVDDDTGFITSFETVHSVLYRLINDVEGCYSSIKKSATEYLYSNNTAISQLKAVLSL